MRKILLIISRFIKNSINLIEPNLSEFWTFKERRMISSMLGVSRCPRKKWTTVPISSGIKIMKNFWRILNVIFRYSCKLYDHIYPLLLFKYRGSNNTSNNSFLKNKTFSTYKIFWILRYLIKTNTLSSHLRKNINCCVPADSSIYGWDPVSVFLWCHRILFHLEIKTYVKIK